MKTRKKFTSDYKVKVVLDTLSERTTIAQLAKKYGIHPTQITTWKKQFLKGCYLAFEKGAGVDEQEHERQKSLLYEKIGKQDVEIDYLKKRSQM